MGTKAIISKSKLAKTIEPKDYPRLMADRAWDKDVFYMVSPTKGICLTNHHKSYQGVLALNKQFLKDFNGALKIFNTH